ncbi:GtrA family protein [Methylomonas sp. EFPC1]|uniref:GtrA family protein n=1 Tax=Methylomonas defluvii TaxID=3045149 RepID=UPI001968A1B4|nr:GtrA family protein [Methylomonas sp. EFPC1]
MRKLRVEATRFTLVGGANFVLTFFIFTSMLKLLEVNYLLSLLTAWGVGMIFSYTLNFMWVFNPEQKIQFRARFFKFLLASVLSILLNMWVLDYIVETTNVDPFLVQMALIPFIVAFNFTTAKLWSMR